MSKAISKRAVLFFLIWLLKVPLAAQTQAELLIKKAGLLENHNWRISLISEMTKPLSQLREKIERYAYRNEAPHANEAQEILLKIFLKKSAVYFLFINKVDGKYPEAARGNFLIRRSLLTGRFESILVFYRNEEGCYLELIAQGNNTLFNVYLFGRLQYKNLILPFRIDEYLKTSFANLIAMTWGRVAWEKLLLEAPRPEDRQVEVLVQQLKERLPQINPKDDGAMDEKGRYVYIASGKMQTNPLGFNCSGFVKWLTDGFYYNLTGRLLELSRLKQKHPELRGNRLTEKYDDERDPFFGLDWIRNCAVALYEAQTAQTNLAPTSRDIGVIEGFSYLKDIGFKISDLKQILFYLLQANPGKIYLGAVNYVSSKNPFYISYYHVLALIPYFDAQGEFRILVFDQHKDLSFDSFQKKYQNENIYLTQLDVTTGFSPIPLLD